MVAIAPLGNCGELLEWRLATLFVAPLHTGRSLALQLGLLGSMGRSGTLLGRSHGSHRPPPLGVRPAPLGRGNLIHAPIAGSALCRLGPLDFKSEGARGTADSPEASSRTSPGASRGGRPRRRRRRALRPPPGGSAYWRTQRPGPRRSQRRRRAWRRWWRHSRQGRGRHASPGTIGGTRSRP